MVWVTVSGSFGKVSVNGGEAQQIQSFQTSIGEILNLLCTPNTGYEFDHWLVDTAYYGNNNPIEIEVTHDQMNISARCIEEGSGCQTTCELSCQGGCETGCEVACEISDETNGGSVEKTVSVYEDEPLKAETWDDDQRKTKEVKVPTANLVYAAIEATISYSMGSGEWTKATLSLNGREVGNVQVDKGATQKITSEVTSFIEGGNLVQIQMSSRVGYWMETIWDVKLILQYSKPPGPIPGVCPFPLIPRLGLTPISGAPVLCGIWSKIQDMRVGE